MRFVRSKLKRTIQKLSRKAPANLDKYSVIGKCLLVSLIYILMIICVIALLSKTNNLIGTISFDEKQNYLSPKGNERVNWSSSIPGSFGRKLWLRISSELFVYSGYLDTRSFSAYSSQNVATGDSDKLTLIRLVGIKGIPPLKEFIKKDILDWFRMKHEMDFGRYECRLFDDLRNISSSRVTYTVIEEGVKKFAATYINCYFNLDNADWINKNTLQVALYPRNVSDYPTKLIDVGNKMGNYQEGTIAVCVRPLFGPFNSLEKLIQFISYYSVVGITQFNFYLMSVSPKVRELLTKFRDKALPRFILHEWNLPTGNTSELWDYGTLAALNDCLLSNADQEFILFVDIDEFIVPQNDISKKSLWDIINSYERNRTYQYLIRNTFFCEEFCNFNNLSEKKSEVSLLPGRIKEFPIFRCTNRTKRVWNVNLRSKFIVNPRQVLSVGHHLVTKYVNRKMDFRFNPGYSVTVGRDVAVMNHYRECRSIHSKKHRVFDRQTEKDERILGFRGRMKAFLDMSGINPV